MDKRIQRVRDDVDYKLKLIDEFGKTLDEYEWNIKVKEEEKEMRKVQNSFFIESIKSEKYFQK